ncbi:trifunctional serine/threonine-protein kinase/ATP-binding protein/sensor histidine kinase [Chondromyces crocatus]|uniref:histidine kinase n=1 Tax=Chondromyces crocatus TaxID=52 RepID=A0A0K1EQT2_CHOCO|nr:ATP-binding sensor histidine kinase [Chondromyces crocatus]AKT43285.1 ATPase [Chondromyces crocatus]
MLVLPGYTAIETLHESSQSLVYRARRGSDGQRVVFKVLHDEYPSASRLARFTREFEIARAVAGDGVIEAFSLERYRNTALIRFEDFGGESLGRVLRARAMAPAEVCRVGARIAEILERVHACRVIHKDVSPGNVVYNADSGTLKLIDFGIAASLPREEAEAALPQALEGTLAYIAPEQTGRMNRGVDCRADLYSLGATLYHLCTGRPPFRSEDALELIHAHIARVPEAPTALDAAIPASLSCVLLKLLAKAAEERYQSAAGVRADLLRCLDGIERGEVGVFTLGRHDGSERLLIPERLYGRERVLEELLAAVERTADGGSVELVLLPGAAGVGKSSLMLELQRPIVARQGHHAVGKFDQLRRDIPNSALLQGLRQLLRQVLTAGDTELAAYRQAVAVAVGEMAGVVLGVLPEAAPLFERPGAVPVPELPPLEAQRRFHRALTGFIGALVSTLHPLVLVIDDLHWADGASLKLLEHLVTSGELHHTLIVGAYRDNEVDAAHPLALFVRALEAVGAPLSSLEVEPLGREHVAALVADALHCPVQESAPLASLCAEKTAGNPFFLGRFLETLHAEGLLGFDREAGVWRFDLGEILRVGITENVVELMAERMRKLPEASQDALRLAACVGGTFALSTLSVVSRRRCTEVARALWPALEAGVIVPLDAAYKFADSTDACDVRYRFAHDRVQQAAYSLIAPEGRVDAHVQIGRLLRAGLASNGKAERGKKLFEVVGHLNLGRVRLEVQEERCELARLNLEAGRKACAAGAYEQARGFFDIGLELLGVQAWAGHYAWWLELSLAAASTAYLTGDHERMEQLVGDVLQFGDTLLDRVRAEEVRIQAYVHQGREQDSLRVGLAALASLGVSLPARHGRLAAGVALLRLRGLLVGRRVEDFAALPPMRDPERLAAMRLFALTSGPVYNTAVELAPYHALEHLRSTLDHGSAPESVSAYLNAAFLCGGVLGDVGMADRLAQLALHLTQHAALQPLRARSIFMAHCFVSPWCRPLRETLDPALEGYQSGLASGDLEYAYYCALLFVGHGFYAGLPLESLDRSAVAFGQAMRRIGDPYVLRRLQLLQQPIQNLMGKAVDPRLLSGAICSEDELLSAARARGDRYTEASFHVMKLILCTLFGDHAEALRHAALAERGEQHMLATENVAQLHIYRALAELGTLGVPKRGERSPSRWLAASVAPRALLRVRGALARLRGWARRAPSNHAPWVALVEAEFARVMGDRGSARAHYDKAMGLAREHGSLLVEALAGEYAARFYVSTEAPHLVEVYAREAHHAYQRWGAEAKARELEVRYPFVLERHGAGKEGSLSGLNGMTSTTTTTTSKREDELDLVSLLKASQALSGEIVLDDLLRRMMQTLLEAAGARRGLLVVDGNKEEGSLVVEADIAAGEAQVVRGSSLDGRSDVALSVVRYVERTRETVVLADAAVSGTFQQDPSVVARRLRSVLCMPVLRQQRRVGLLYLENGLASNVFTPSRCKVLEMLAAQAAISLENAQLYETLDNRVKARTLELSEALVSLREAQRQLVLQEKLASLGMLTSGIAHEIKNPLNFVINFADVSVEMIDELAGQVDMLGAHVAPDVAASFSALTTDLHQNVTRIGEHGRRADRIVRAMLEHSRSRVGEAREVELGKLLREYTAAALQAQPSCPPLSVRWELDPSLRSVRLVPEEIGRVILNLVSNAIYALEARRRAEGPDYTPSLRVSSCDRGDQVEIRVCDNGGGIPGEIRDKVFNPFFTTKPTGVGTGLGLSISYDIVVQGHGGTMALESKEGEFTELTVRLPKRRRSSLASSSSASTRPSEPCDPLDGLPGSSADTPA